MFGRAHVAVFVVTLDELTEVVAAAVGFDPESGSWDREVESADEVTVVVDEAVLANDA